MVATATNLYDAKEVTVIVTLYMPAMKNLRVTCIVLQIIRRMYPKFVQIISMNCMYVCIIDILEIHCDVGSNPTWVNIIIIKHQLSIISFFACFVFFFNLFVCLFVLSLFSSYACIITM